MVNSAARHKQRFLATRTISSDQVYQGAVLWLPKRPWHHTSTVDQISPKRRGLTSWSVYKHPILVLSRPLHDSAKIHFVILTTFGGSRGKPRLPDAESAKYHKYLPIDPSEPCRCCKALARYRNGLTASQKGYVSFRAVYSMRWADAQPYADLAPGRPPDMGPWVLEDASMGIVLDWAFQDDRLRYNPGEQYFEGATSPYPIGNRRRAGQDEPDRPRSLIDRISSIVSQGRNSLLRKSK